MVMLKLTPAVEMEGVPNLPVGVPGANASPGTSTSRRSAAPGFSVTVGDEPAMPAVVGDANSDFTPEVSRFGVKATEPEASGWLVPLNGPGALPSLLVS